MCNQIINDTHNFIYLINLFFELKNELKYSN